MQVSIIIPTFNSVKYLKETLDSVFAQNYQHFECILVDDGSTDSTLALISEYQKTDPRFHFYNRPQELQKGPSSCRNFGIQKAKGDYLIFLDADDLLAPDCLKNRIEAFDKHQNCDFLVFQMERFSKQPDFSVKTKKAVQDKHAILQSFFELHAQWPITSPIYKATFLEKISFNPALLVFEDLEVAIKSILVASDFKVFETVDCYYRNDENYKAKFESIEMKTKMIHGFELFLITVSSFIKHQESAFSNVELKSNLVRSYKKIFTWVILDNSKKFHGNNINMLRVLSKNDFLSMKQQVLWRFSSQILVPFATLKGSGISRLIRFLYR